MGPYAAGFSWELEKPKKHARDTPEGDLSQWNGKNVRISALCGRKQKASAFTWMGFPTHVLLLWVCTCVGGVSVHVSVCDCRGQRSVSGVLFHHFQSIPLKQGLPLNLTLSISMMLLDSQAPAYLCCPLPGLQATRPCLAFTWVLRIQIWVLMVTQ